MKISALPNAPKWLTDADTVNADVRYGVAGAVVWDRGAFRGGAFRGGEFRGGAFWGGEFRGGEFWGGRWLATPRLVLDLGSSRVGHCRSLQFLDGTVRYRAGCHLFTLAEARAYWGDPNHPDRDRADENLRVIDFAEGEARRLGWLKPDCHAIGVRA